MHHILFCKSTRGLLSPLLLGFQRITGESRWGKFTQHGILREGVSRKDLIQAGIYLGSIPSKRTLSTYWLFWNWPGNWYLQIHVWKAWGCQSSFVLLFFFWAIFSLHCCFCHPGSFQFRFWTGGPLMPASIKAREPHCFKKLNNGKANSEELGNYENRPNLIRWEACYNSPNPLVSDLNGNLMVASIQGNPRPGCEC